MYNEAHFNNKNEINIKLQITAVKLKITVLYSQWPHCNFIYFSTAHDL